MPQLPWIQLNQPGSNLQRHMSITETHTSVMWKFTHIALNILPQAKVEKLLFINFQPVLVIQ